MNKTCAFCINCTHWLFAGHGLDNAFFENTEIYIYIYIYMGKIFAGN